jgi:hypothetical protein
MKAFAMCSYWISADRNFTINRRPEDWGAFNFIQALKRRTFRGYANVPVGTKTYRLQQSNADSAFQWFGEMVSSSLRVTVPATLVPLPDSECTAAAARNALTSSLAESIAANLPKSTVWNGLKWRHPMERASEGGTREPEILYDSLVITEPVPKRSHIIIVDDVLTSSGHLRAAAAKLRDARVDCETAIVGGRTVYEQPAHAFDVVEEEIEEFTR